MSTTTSTQPSSDVPRGTAPSIAVSGLTRGFGDRPVIRDLSWSRMAHGVVGVVGPNGAGKTTFARIVAQLIEPDDGTVELCGVSITGPNAFEARRYVGYAPHRPLLRSMRSVAANLQHAARLYGFGAIEAAAEVQRVAASWDMTALLPMRAGALSRGQVQRCVLAMADLGSPPIVVLDEPTVGLDEAGRRALEGAIDRWKDSRIVLVTSHERAWLDSFVDDVLDLGAAPVMGGEG